MKKALVLGAGGFIGSHMVKRLKKEGYWVRGVDLKYPEFSKTEADDFIVASGNSYSLKHFIDRAFYLSGLGSSSKYLDIHNFELRPNEIESSYLNPLKAKTFLNWENKLNLDTIITKLLEEELF